MEKLIAALGYDHRQSVVMHVNFGILEEDCCRMSFLRGAFLAGGSVTDPEKRYHLELATNHIQASREVSTVSHLPARCSRSMASSWTSAAETVLFTLAMTTARAW